MLHTVTWTPFANQASHLATTAPYYVHQLRANCRDKERLILQLAAPRQQHEIPLDRSKERQKSYHCQAALLDMQYIKSRYERKTRSRLPAEEQSYM